MVKVVPYDSSPKRVVIAGAGHGGAAVASALEKRLKGTEIIVLEKREASLHKPAILRGMVNGEKFSGRTVIPNKKLIRKNGTVKHIDVERVDQFSVSLASENEKTLVYDYLVCAPGSRNVCADPPEHLISRGEIMSYYDDIAAKIKEANRIVIVGGGPVAVELVGEIKDIYREKSIAVVNNEIKDIYREKSIAVVNNKDRLFYKNPSYASGFHKKINRQLKSMGVEVYNNECVEIEFEKDEPVLVGTINAKTSTGKELLADLAINATGSKLNNEIYPRDWLNEKGQIRVRRTLQLEEFDNIFAVGDINDVKETKLAYSAMQQALIIAHNIQKLEQKKHSEMKDYVPGKPIIAIPIGRKKGAIATPWFTLGKFTTSMAKGKHLFVQAAWKIYNQREDLPFDGTNKKSRLSFIC